jgi:hypothetical protein
MTISVEVGIGEFLDKFSILDIKSEMIKDPEKLNNVLKERNILWDNFKSIISKNPKLVNLYNELLLVNKKLWEVEDILRKHEREKKFDEDFIKYARLVYTYNDLRAETKKSINLSVGSKIIEEKSYEKY